MSSEHPITLQHKITFILLGIASLIGWNAILTALSFFSTYYPKDEYGGDVSFLFPIPLFFGNFIWGLLVPKLGEFISLTKRISLCLAAICVFMICLPLITIGLQNKAGFALCLICTFIIGSFNSIAQNSCIGLASQVDGSLTGLYWVSTGISGLTMNAANAITLASFGDSDDGLKIGTIIYFAIAVIITLLAIWSQIAFVKSDYYLDIKKQHEESGQDNEEDNTVSAISGEEETPLVGKKKSIGEQLKAYGNKILSGIKLARFVPFFIYLIYVQTFMLFPGVSVFSKPSYTYLPGSWPTLVMLTTYNVGDIIGKYICNFKFYNIPILYGVVISRFVFFVTFLMTMHQPDNSFFSNDAFAYVNMLLFAITNGFCTGGLMFLGPTRGNNKKQAELIAFINSFSLTFGIACGSFLAPTLSG
ncbi:equilibrative nucleoside transporter family protein (macronuclear) [Tetrahymena thermophila SB210]|uniref:Equilibrative nucleoside transporter family protein n=1 Tax=Tetrahymena thermophila (strain SB210) TaxID=312017 RepID=I7M2I3_TETTS|nr:equilibrative nucleoside transporter family protein [Tetrahymena thermophila SB210]EAS00442.1 equilibrative nucleoside transporter family protein [Tetrahymena thermophila SB210]|eukprot:XP_001020687.1 equilibrative nucleoside transporter family protein [Tetrahymena thermophila SB210]